MKKSKITLLLKIILVILIVYNCISIISCINKKEFNKDKLDNIGTITNLKKTENKIVLTINSNKKILAYISNSKTSPLIGDVINYKYEYKDINNTYIINSFNYDNYLKSLNIYNVINITSYKKVGKNKLYKLKKYIIDRIDSKKSRNYIYAFLLSDKSYIDSNVKDSYNFNGISHMLCVSGFHIYFLLNILKSLFNKFKIKKYISGIFIFIFLLTYLFISDFSISLSRAFLLYYLNCINKSLDLKINKYIIYILVLNLCLLNNTHTIFNTGFWYTFSLSFFLISYENNEKQSFKKKINLSIFMFIVSIPLTIYFNYQINLLTVIYNIIFLYLVCYIIYPLCFISIFSNIADIVLLKISRFFELVNIKLSDLNMFKIVFPKPNIVMIIFLYLLIFLYLKYKKNKIIIFYILTLIVIKYLIYFDSSSYVYFLNVSQGDMAVYITSNHRSVNVIDTGGLEYNKYLYKNIESFLHSVSIKKIDNLIISHGDNDHMGEAINLVNNFKVEKVIFNCGEFNDLEKDLIKLLDKKKIPYYSCIKELNIDNSKLYFLQTKEYDNENDNSNVIYTEINGYKFMFMGDASSTTEKEILDKYNLPDIDVLKVGHHGSKTSSSKEFINDINPKYSIISVGKNNRYGHPNKEVLNNLSDSKIYRTDLDGSIMFKIRNNKLQVETYAP
ncbi:MAG: DNA internalization-related competence protein ComEC/Rec2 [Bacilli bacterium]|nr:DNA internalization-related competence protein ComEC/Rec2 [Bacilli bacterium]